MAPKKVVKSLSPAAKIVKSTMAKAKQVTKSKLPVQWPIAKADQSVAQSIENPVVKKVRPKIASLALAVKIQTAEGWKRGAARQRQLKKSSKS